MTKTAIRLVAGIQDVTLLVFHIEVHCWQFWVISALWGSIWSTSFTTCLKLLRQQGVIGLPRAVKRDQISQQNTITVAFHCYVNRWV